jgi:hypothetical protein
MFAASPPAHVYVNRKVCFSVSRSRDGIEIAAVPVPSVTKFSTIYEIRY